MGSFQEWEREGIEAEILRGAKVNIRRTAALLGLDRRAWTKRVHQLQRQADHRLGGANKRRADLAS